MMDDPLQLTLLHFARFTNKRPRTDQSTNQGHASASVEQSLPSHSNRSVNDSERDDKPELLSDIQMHQDELSEIRDGVTSDSEPVLSIANPDLSNSATCSTELGADSSPILIDDSSDDHPIVIHFVQAQEKQIKPALQLVTLNLRSHLVTLPTIHSVPQHVQKISDFQQQFFLGHLDASILHGTRSMIGLSIQLNVMHAFVILVSCLVHKLVHLVVDLSQSLL